MLHAECKKCSLVCIKGAKGVMRVNGAKSEAAGEKKAMQD
jgi:hypothetical protein